MKFRIFLKSFTNQSIQIASEEIAERLSSTDCIINGVVALPTKIKRFCVLRSPHVDKDSREHFEVRLYKRIIDLTTSSPSVLDSLFKIELPSGIFCSLKILETN